MASLLIENRTNIFARDPVTFCLYFAENDVS